MPKSVECTREDLQFRYAKLVRNNPLLARIEGQCKTISWTDEEIRTFQLIVAVESNASLQARLAEVERKMSVQTSPTRMQ